MCFNRAVYVEADNTLAIRACDGWAAWPGLREFGQPLMWTASGWLQGLRVRIGRLPERQV
jgi:hypothetical protein